MYLESCSIWILLIMQYLRLSKHILEAGSIAVNGRKVREPMSLAKLFEISGPED